MFDTRKTYDFKFRKYAEYGVDEWSEYDIKFKTAKEIADNNVDRDYLTDAIEVYLDDELVYNTEWR